MTLSKVIRMRHLFAITFLLSAVFPAQAQFGSIRGVVLSQEGKPEKGADVIATSTGPMADRPPATVLRKRYLTDDAGNFVIHGLQFDEYVVTAYKEDEDYPKLVGTWLRFYKESAEPRVKLTMQNPAATVEIRLGPKAGVLVGAITNASTGAPTIACAGFKPISAPDFDTAHLVSTRFRLLIPADTDVTVKVWWDGYKPWYYPEADQNVAGTSLRLKASEEKTINIALQPDQSIHSVKCGIDVFGETAINP